MSSTRIMSRSMAPSRLSHLAVRHQTRGLSITRSLREQQAGPTYQAPTPPSNPTGGNPHRNFWKLFGRPIAKVFLGAMFTYQVLYWSWLKLESIDDRVSKDEEIRLLEAKLTDSVGQRKKEA